MPQIAATLWLLFTRDSRVEPSSAQMASGAVGLALAITAVVLMLWSKRAFPSVSTGHYVLPEQRIVSSVPYALVRHPLCAATFYDLWYRRGSGCFCPSATDERCLARPSARSTRRRVLRE